MVGKPVSSLALIFNIMIYITILSQCQFGIEYTDEIETSLDLTHFNFKIWDVLKLNQFYPERTIKDIKVNKI